MNGQPLKHKVLITNPAGFHMRPIGAFVQEASRFKSKVTVSRDDHSADGKSMMDMLAHMLSMPDTELTLEVDGPDADDCLNALLAVFTAPPEPDT
jgi:phosphocarrier protein HPr